MNLQDYLAMLVETYNPNKYAKLVERPMREFIAFLIMTVGISLLIFTILFIPATYYYTSTIQSRLSDVQQLYVDAQVSATAPVELVAEPHITLDLEANGTRSGLVTLSSEGVLLPKYLFWGTKTLPWSDLQDLKQPTTQRNTLISSIILFLLPSIMFWFFFFSLLLCAALFFLIVLAAYFLPRLAKHRITAMESMKVAIIAIPSVLLFGLGLYPLSAIAVLWVGVALTAVIAGIAMATISEHQIPERKQGKV